MSNTYKIIITGILDSQWSAWFDNASITSNSDGTTVLMCEVIDQAALYGLLRKMRDAGLELQSVTRIDADDDASSQSNNNE